MARIWLPGNSDFALALREPNLLTAGKKPVAKTTVNRKSEYSALYAPLTLHNALPPALSNAAYIRNGLEVTSGTGKINTGFTAPVSTFVGFFVVIFEYQVAGGYNGNFERIIGNSRTGTEYAPAVYFSSAVGINYRSNKSNATVTTLTSVLPIVGHRHCFIIGQGDGPNNVYFSLRDLTTGQLLSSGTSKNGTMTGDITSTVYINSTEYNTRALIGTTEYFGIYEGDYVNLRDQISKDPYNFLLRSANDTPSIVGSAAAGGGITGNLAAQETGSDGAAITGDVLVAGTLATQETGADGATITGSVHVSGTLSVQEVGADTAAINGSSALSGDLAAQEVGSDTAAVTGAVVVSGTLAVQETGSDIAAVTGTVQVAGTLSVQETGSDTALITGAGFIVGNLATQEAGADTGALTGKVIVGGTLAAVEVGSDTVAISGSAPTTITGDLAAVETGSDSAALTGAIEILGTLTAVETGADTALISGSAPTVINGDLAVIEIGDDTASVTGGVTIAGALAALELGADTANIRERDLSTGNLIVIEGTVDTLSVGGLLAGNYDADELLTVLSAYHWHAQPAVYTDPAGVARVVQVVLSISESLVPSGAEIGVREQEIRVRVRKSELELPERRARLSINGVDYRVDGYGDQSSYEWVIDASA